MPTQGSTAMPDSQQTLENTVVPETAQPESSSGDTCRFCASRQFKRSRLHTGDLLTLLRLRRPARCLKCGQLQTISLKTAKSALPAGNRNGPTHEVRLPQPAQPIVPAPPVAQPIPPVQPVRDSRTVRPVALTESGVRAQHADNRDAIPHALLRDALDIRCQYCPAQAFRRSRFRLQDVMQILTMRYSVRCLRCGQRQVVNFMVAASGVPSSYKQARALRNTETWEQFTASAAPPAPRVKATAPLAPVIGQTYTLKDIPVGQEVALPTTMKQEHRLRESKPTPASVPTAPVKRRSEDESIW